MLVCFWHISEVWRMKRDFQSPAVSRHFKLDNENRHHGRHRHYRAVKLENSPTYLNLAEIHVCCPNNRPEDVYDPPSIRN